MSIFIHFQIPLLNLVMNRKSSFIKFYNFCIWKNFKWIIIFWKPSLRLGARSGPPRSHRGDLQALVTWRGVCHGVCHGVCKCV